MRRLVAFAAWLLLSVPVASAQEAGPFGLSYDGTEFKAAFSDAREAMIGMYGDPAEDHDFSTANQRRSADWMTSLFRKQQVLGSGWKMQGRDDAVTGVSIDALGVDYARARVVASYQFSNFEQCSGEFPGY